MKKKSYLLLIVFLCLSVSVVFAIGYSTSLDESSKDGLQLYYRNTSNEMGQIIATENWNSGDQDFVDHYALLERLLEGPKSSDLVSPFPEGCELYKVLLKDDGSVSVWFTKEYETLSGYAKTIAEACVVLTLSQDKNITEVHITYRGNLELPEVLTSEDIVLQESEEYSSENEITIYYPDEDLNYLVPTTRTVLLSGSKTTEQYILEELMGSARQDDEETADEDADYLFENVELLGVYISKEICYVDLSGEFLKTKPSSAAEERMLIYSIVNSLTDVEGISSVQFLVEGNPIGRYLYMNLQEPLVKNELIVNSPGRSGEQMKLTVYLPREKGAGVSVLPVIVEKEGYGDAAAALTAILELDIPQGYEAVIPSGTKLLSAEITNRICYVNLSSEFINGQNGGHRGEMLSAYMIAATLLELDGIEGVQIMIEGVIKNQEHFQMDKPIYSDDILIES